MKISLCIPMYNEEGIIEDTLNSVSRYMEKTFSDYEVIFSDDGSADNTRKIVEGFPDKRIKIVGNEKNMGKGAAIRRGVMSAEGGIIIFTDCDLAYGLDVIKTAVDIFAADDTADMVIGSRNITKDGYEGYTFLRRLASKVYIKCLGIAAGFKLSDSQCGFKAFRGETAHEIFSKCKVNGFAFDFEVLMSAEKTGKKIVEMPVKVINHRESKVHVLRDSVKMLRDIRRIKRDIKNRERTGEL